MLISRFDFHNEWMSLIYTCKKSLLVADAATATAATTKYKKILK